MMQRRSGVSNFARGTLLPVGSLTAPDGRKVILRDLRGPLVLFAVHSAGCAGCLGHARAISAAAPAVAEWGGSVVIVVPDHADGGGEPSLPGVRILRDFEGTIAERLDAGVAALLIADEWGEIYFAAETGPEHALPDAEEIVEWVRFIAIQCPECEQPEGEWRNV